MSARMNDSLFGLIPAASDGRQWTAHSMQLVNWGGYHGHHEVRFSGGATLLSGASGSGKSTLLDAYIALMMSHTTPFNGASNGTTSGRARGREQRSVLSYARGKVDESREDGSTSSRDRVLRGDGVDTWSAISMTWTDQSGSALTALRAWYVPRDAQRNEECVVVRATADEVFDLRRLEDLAPGRFARPGLADAGLSLFDTDVAFATRLHAALGIGAAGDGHKAMQLLGRIQAGQAITTVDALYKAMVLEEPETLAVAQRAVEHFDELAAVREEMLTATRQVEVLRPMIGLRDQIDEAAASVALLDGLGAAGASTGGGPTPFTAWRDARRLALVRAEEATNRAAHRTAQERRAAAAARITTAEGELDEARAARTRQGGDAVEGAEREVRRAAERLEAVRTARASLDPPLDVLGRTVGSEPELARLQREGRAFVENRSERAASRESATFAARQHASDVGRRLVALEAEKESFSRRRGNVGAEDDAARCALAEAAGLAPEELPFVAELLEVRPAYEPWRDAIGTALGGFATVVLVDHARLDRFRSAIDSVDLRRRVRFEGAETGLPLADDADPATLPGRVEVKAGPFGGWLAERLDQRFDHVCVDDPGELSRHPRALTRTGQVSDGRRGAHGGGRRASVLGFSNAARLDTLTEEITAARTDLREAEAAAEEARHGDAAETDRVVAYTQCLAVAWEDVDVAGAEAALAERTSRRDALLAGSDVLQALQDDEERIRTRLTALYRERADAENQVQALAEQWAAITDLVDEVTDAVAQADDGPSVGTAEQTARLDAALDAVLAEPATSVAAFSAATHAVVRELERDREAAVESGRSARAALGAIFERFCDTWPNPNLGTDPEASYADFLRVYEEIEHQQLYQLQERWSRTIGRLSGNDLTLLNSVMTRSVAEIRERMEPVNAILSTLPFRDDEHRLRITATVTEAADISSFRRALRDLAADPGEQTAAQRTRRFDRMARLIDRIRPDSPERRRLVDVRDHVRISAECVDLDGTHVSVYDHIAGKSGGESQELVAFIVGAALRYQLGDAGAARPRYAPVFLDEAFIKADARFAGRAVGAWRGLGFQLVIGAPLDKVGALEPHVDVVLQAVKDDRGRSRLVTLVGAPEPAPATALR
ncbi:ATP-binding protein [Paraoerskovia marina]|uniref:ATP-binding protein n=1 Tax=Paraoerskovia marina TaxID=545619 RepID=UPI000A521318|nr:SbcC/MukB-like Walker B domain-containing protein [Paraoerskovia marina]